LDGRKNDEAFVPVMLNAMPEIGVVPLFVSVA
jgi:hypothetical protein